MVISSVYYPHSHDFENYEIFSVLIQDSIPNIISESRFGLGYIIFIKIISIFSSNNYILIGINIVLFFQYLILLKYAKSITIFIIFFGLYLFLLNCTQIRESIVVTLILYLILTEKYTKKNTYNLISFTAFFFHYSAVLILLKNINKYYQLFIFIILLLISYIFLENFTYIMSDYDSLILQYFQKDFLRNYSNPFLLTNILLLLISYILKLKYNFGTAILILGIFSYIGPFTDLIAHRILELSLIGGLSLIQLKINIKYTVFIVYLPIIIYINVQLLSRIP